MTDTINRQLRSTGNAPEVEITPEMIEAGKDVLCGMTTYFGADEGDWAEQVYRVMFSLRPAPREIDN
jgi:hypothetical protein